jgi:hypothetical protein
MRATYSECSARTAPSRGLPTESSRKRTERQEGSVGETVSIRSASPHNRSIR